MGTVRIINMIPAAMSGEENQDSEPNLAINPERPTDMVGSAFTPAPLGVMFAPIYISTNGGNTWELRTVIRGAGTFGTGDITVGFATSGGILYAAILSGATPLRMQILRTSNFATGGAMDILFERDSVDQPWVVAGSIVVSGTSRDRVYVGNNNFNQPGGRTATVDRSLDAATAPNPAGFSPFQIERGTTMGQDGPPIRTALHPDGTVYAAFHRWAPGPTFPDLNVDIVVTRDDNWATGPNPFNALVDSITGVVGQRVAANRFIRFNAQMGQERLGGDLSIAVDPTDSGTVWVAWCDRVGGASGTDWTLHVSRSTNRGQTWSADLRTITNAKNPSLAVNANRLLGLVYQQFTGTQWVTHLELTPNAWGSAETHVLHRVPSNTPARNFLPYIGDYVRLLAVGQDFYGVFSGNNTPDLANFPNGVTYQRNADWTAHTLLNTNGITPVRVSIDPFFFHWSENIFPRGPIIPRGPVPISRGPVITRGPIGPIEPIEPIEPINPPPITPPSPEEAPPTSSASGASRRSKRGTGRKGSQSSKPPTDIEL